VHNNVYKTIALSSLRFVYKTVNHKLVTKESSIHFLHN